VKFLRHLTAVLLAVAVIVALGMLWAHASGGGTGIGSDIRRAPSREALQRLQQIKAGVIPVHSDNGFHLADTGDLIRTCMIEAALAAVVITVSATRRRYRRTRRTADAQLGEDIPPQPDEMLGDGLPALRAVVGDAVQRAWELRMLAAGGAR
jgi:hypothetical protein